MPDIRQSTAFLDDFDRTNENPLAGPTGIEWSLTDTAQFPVPLVTVASSRATHGGALTGDMYWNQFTMDGNDAEAWGIAVGGGAGGIAWAIDLWTNPGGSNTSDGYRFRLEASGGGPVYVMYRVDNGTATGLTGDAAPSDNEPGYLLIRRNGGNVEGWATGSPFDSTSWYLATTLADSTYTTGLYGGIGIRDNSGSQILSWQAFGGGVEDFVPQIYRRPNE